MIPIAFRQSCWRLRAQRPASPLSRLAGAAEVDSLRDLVRRTAVQPLGSRFSDGSFRPLYAALEPPTCEAEVIFHWTRTFRLSACPAGTPLRTVLLTLGVHGERFLDVRAGHDDLHDPDSYRASQRFGLDAFLAGEDGVLYRSVRNPGGTCVAAIRAGVAETPREHSERRFVWTGDRFQAAS